MKKQTGEVIKLSKEENDSLTNTPLRTARKDFEELDRWRSDSLKSDIRIG